MCQSKFSTCKRVISDETAKSWYTSALDKLNLFEWKNSLSCPDDCSDGTATDVKCATGKTCTCFIIKETGENEIRSMKAGPETKMGAKHNRKTKNAAKVLPKDSNVIVENKPRLTRSRYRSSQNQHTSTSSKSEFNEIVGGNQVSAPSEMLSQKEPVLNKIGCSISSSGPITCVLSKMRCWQCLPSEVLKSGLLDNFINLKWEFVRRKLSMKLLTRLGMRAISHFLFFTLLM